MADDIQYLQATEQDVAILVNCQMDFSEEFLGKQPEELTSTLRKNLTRFYTDEINKTYISWYATVNGEVASVGGLCIRRQPGNVKNPSGVWGYLFGIYTLPAHRRKGLSRNIVERLMQTAKEMGITALELHSTQAGEPLYLQSGFQMHNEPTYRQFLTP